eukprot:1160455-Pelagomonas_calceolata.AAC.5
MTVHGEWQAGEEPSEEKGGREGGPENKEAYLSQRVQRKEKKRTMKPNPLLLLLLLPAHTMCYIAGMAPHRGPAKQTA